MKEMLKEIISYFNTKTIIEYFLGNAWNSSNI